MYRSLNESSGSAFVMNLFKAGGLPVLMLWAAMLLVGASACQQRRSTNPTAGDPQRGALLISREGCGGCHSIPGIGNADGLVGPPLGNIARRTMLAGLLPNTPANMVQWLQSPQALIPGNAMPDMGLSRRDATDIAAYLYTMR
jgi:cytochrome c2